MTSTDHSFEGPLTVDHRGAGYIAVGAGETVRVDPDDLGDALHGDVVRIRALRAGGPLRGRVAAVAERPPRRLVGVVEAGRWFLADDERFRRALEIHGATAVDGDLICGVELLPWTAGGPEVRLGPVFGERGQPRAEVDALLWREAIVARFPREVLAEAEVVAAAPQRPASDRVDLRRWPFVTIDPASAEDHDDAVLAEARPDGSTLVAVAIADVAAFVTPGGAVDREARRRGTSVYLPGRVLPMLPARISNDAASLMAGVDRVAVVLEMTIDETLVVRATRLRRAVIRVDAALTYDDVAEVLAGEGRRGPDAARRHATMLGQLDRLAQKLRAGRQRHGAFSVDLPPVAIECDRLSGLPSRIVRVTPTRQQARAHQLVEELMLLANTVVADMLHERGADTVFRSHDAPPVDRLGPVVAAAKRHGVELDTPDAGAVRDAIARISDPEARRDVSAAFLESMSPARYGDTADDHFALASQRYVHFTSPIRRYADLAIHRALLGASGGDLAAVARDINEAQRRARSVQRQIDDLYGALLMEHRIGERVAGTVVRVTGRQVLVAGDDPAVVLRCRRPADPPDVGSPVVARVDAVSIGARTIEATIVENA